MADPTPDPEVREALEELQQYLSDTLPPLVVADSIELLLRYPPELTAAAIRGWMGAQYGRGATSDVPLSDYLFHAVKKMYLIGEFNLVPREPFQVYLQQIKQLVFAFCPTGERELLRESFDRLGESSGGPAATQAQTIFRQRPVAERTRAEPAAGDAGLKRFSLFLERLDAEARTRGPAGSPAVSPETLAAAARSSHSAEQIESYLERLQQLGVDVGTRDVFRALAESLPGWTPPSSSGGWGGASGGSAVEAMRRMVTEAADPVEGARRFQELVRAAIDRFNEGSLTQAVSTLELAEKLIAEKKVDPGTVEVARRKGDELLDPDRLKKFAESPTQHASLRRLLGFFHLLKPGGLLRELNREPKRERRRLLLLLLEVHGVDSRPAILEELQSPFDGIGPDEWYYRRNLLYALRRVPRPPEASLEEEIDLVARHGELRFPPPLVREAIANLGQLRHERSERILTQQLADLEGMLSRPGDAPYDPKELTLLLDRVVSALVRFGTPTARRAVLAHAGSKDPRLGNAMGRLAELGTQDLSSDPDFVESLLTLLRSNLPFKLLGLVLQQNDQNLLHVIEALSGTPLPAVRKALEEIAARFSDREFARAAGRVVAGFGVPAAQVAEAAPASLSGDLELFGLPALLQSLSDSALSGTLTLRRPSGETFATVALSGGKLKSCQTGILEGEDAFCQLLERPAPGQFQFARLAAGTAEEPGAALREVLPLTLEAMRRYDEFQGSAALVPDDVPLAVTEMRPTPHPSEKDGMMLQTLWAKVRKGTTARDCEAEICADSYRIRRVLAHWVEEGSVRMGGGGSKPETPASTLPPALG